MKERHQVIRSSALTTLRPVDASPSVVIRTQGGYGGETYDDDALTTVPPGPPSPSGDLPGNAGPEFGGDLVALEAAVHTFPGGKHGTPPPAATPPARELLTAP